MYKIYHNNRCGKSRQTLALLKDHTDESNIEIINYLENGLSSDEIKNIASYLKKDVSEFIRRNEAEFKDYKKIDLSESELIDLLVKIPKLLERPIVIKNKKAIIGRPPENVKTLF